VKKKIAKKKGYSLKLALQNEMHTGLNEVISGVGSYLKSRLSVFLNAIKVVTLICKA